MNRSIRATGRDRFQVEGRCRAGWKRRVGAHPETVQGKDEMGRRCEADRPCAKSLVKRQMWLIWVPAAR
jgi:hypothetical protein